MFVRKVTPQRYEVMDVGGVGVAEPDVTDPHDVVSSSSIFLFFPFGAGSNGGLRL